MPGPIRAVVTGGPGAGKSTLLAELAQHGISVEEEAARAILQAPDGMALREHDPEGFAAAMFAQELAGFHRAGRRNGATVFDRGFPDTVGFLRLEGLPVPEAMDRMCRDLRYTGPIFRAPPWQEIYRSDEERIQDWAEAQASDSAVCAAWRNYGYDLIDLPFVSPAERADFVIERLS
ncbi:AAA family ATPase [Tsuneonella suprasediminis]|uniref:AAA family ATPase n=1 Tax=Tsuneonella suprasediminis TaxID=2306996 RepID=UPI002F92B7A5